MKLQTKYQSILFIALFFVLTFSADSFADSIWVKVQGVFDKDGRLVAEKVHKKKQTRQYVFEGRTHIEDDGTIKIQRYTVSPSAGTKYTFINGDPATPTDIAENVRIKAIGHFEAAEFIADEIKIFQFSQDADIEIEGFIQSQPNTMQTGQAFRIGSVPAILEPSKAKTVGAGNTLTPRDWLGVYGKIKAANTSRLSDDQANMENNSDQQYGSIQAILVSRFSESYKFYGRFELWNRQYSAQQTFSSYRPGSEFKIRSFYFLWQPWAGNQFKLKVGRQRVRDSRSWLTDAYLDAVRMDVRFSRIRFSALYSKDLDTQQTNVSQPHLIANLSYYWGSFLKTTAYLIREFDQRPAEDSPTWLALQASGKSASIFEYWAQGAYYSSQDADITRFGYGVDAGLMVKPLGKYGPLFMYHYAQGSADDPNTPDIRERFRQSKLQLNYYSYGSRRWMYYYGSLLTPELTNLKFQSVTAGYQFKKVHVQLIGRNYAQINPKSYVYSNSLRIEPTGQSTDLGNDLELNFNYYPWNDLELSLSVESFFPGKAFEQKQAIVGIFSGIKYNFGF